MVPTSGSASSLVSAATASTTPAAATAGMTPGPEVSPWKMDSRGTPSAFASRSRNEGLPEVRPRITPSR